MFPSFFMGGFECSTHKLSEGKRLDLISSTHHDRFAHEDYERLMEQGMRVARDGLRWHLIEKTPGHYDFSSLEPMVGAAKDTGILVLWDLLHFGWPDLYDVFSPEFPDRFGNFVQASAEWFRRNAEPPFWFTPVNEISWVAWAGGSAGCINPFAQERGLELKMQLVRCALKAIRIVREVIPDARFTSVDPIVHVVPTPGRQEEVAMAAERNESKFEAWDMLHARKNPELGGSEDVFDVIGVNFYPHNEWILSEEGQGFIRTDHPNYKPFRELLADVWARYKTPIYISETGTEDEERVPWVRYICQEVAAAMEAGVPVEGICIYPIMNHPGWVDDRHCYNGLWDYANEQGDREIYEPLEAEIRRWQQVFDAHDRDRISAHTLEAALGQEPTPHAAPDSHVTHLTGPLQGCHAKPTPRNGGNKS
jgi:beta-glucosidase/6-phospho-beta-glucosidase/beta-galactosidase